MFVHGPEKQIITGNLDLVNNDKLKKLLSQGPKFRELKVLLVAKIF